MINEKNEKEVFQILLNGDISLHFTFISNYMKNTMTEEMVWELCEHISNNYIKKTNTH